MSAGRRRWQRSRREFLGDSLRLAAGASALSATSCFPGVGGRWPGELASCVDLGDGPAPVTDGRVVEIEHTDSVDTTGRPEIRENVVREMLQTALQVLSDDATSPWPVLLPEVGPHTVLGIKVNCLNDQCPTSLPVVRALVDSLKQGLELDGDRIIVWDRRLDELSDCGYSDDSVGARVMGTVTSTDDLSGPGYEVDHCLVVRGKTTHLSRILTELTDLTINCPVLKTHGVSGVTAALKNVYGVIDNPGDFHADLNESLPAIYALPPIRDHIRLTVLDALIAVTSGGTSSPPDTVPRRLLVARDPLALDRYALDLADRMRADKGVGLKPVDRRVTAWLERGAELGLGASTYQLDARALG